MLRVDLHTHSAASADGWMSPTDLVEVALSKGLDRIAITDHLEIVGALKAQARFPDRVIVGEEIHCAQGPHLIGLFLSERIPPGLPVDETARRIRDQGGIVYAAHPFAHLWQSERRARQALAVAEVVEVFNSRAFLVRWNRRAQQAARDSGLPTAASSDAHFPWELGRAYTEIPYFGHTEEFRQALPLARACGMRSGSPWLHIASRAIAEARRVTLRRARARLS